ncbi:MAG: vancomycin resistance histidine kinase VanS, partial [Oscillospiraceae bacterium]
MKKKYTRLKLKMLFFVFIGAVAAAIVGVFLLEWLFNGALGDLLSRLYVMLAETIFGQTHAQAVLAYQHNVLSHREQIIMLAIILLILMGFYMAM